MLFNKLLTQITSYIIGAKTLISLPESLRSQETFAQDYGMSMKYSWQLVSHIHIFFVFFLMSMMNLIDFHKPLTHFKKNREKPEEKKRRKGIMTKMKEDAEFI